MNHTIQSMTNHRSIRRYLEKDIPDDILKNILDATHLMPTSDNGQQISIIVVKNKETKNTLAKLSGGQPWIATAPVFLIFVVDFYKTYLAAKKHQIQQVIQDSAAGAIVGILDCGIALGGAIVAAESLGLGTVAIGGIRSGASEVIKLLNLPKYTFPINGLCIGYPANISKQKPRLPINTFIHNERYNIMDIEQSINEYDDIMKSYLAEIGREKEVDWSTQTSNIYKDNILKHLKQLLADQGFNFN